VRLDFFGRGKGFGNLDFIKRKCLRRKEGGKRKKKDKIKRRNRCKRRRKKERIKE
jgi:hypothetical protein